ncbi:MAG: DUF423 domain-containing protein [Flavobacteriaceae bacterium]|nr:DUF423 domain-containing protein [Flavobacteriaceae bacterium]
MTQQTFIITGALFGMLAIILGAFGAHTLKKVLTEDQLKSFETGVKYQMYHAIVLISLGFNHQFSTTVMYWCFTLGAILFSFSIYGLVLSDAKGKKLKFLGPITPIGGLLFVIGWLLLILRAINI